MVVGAVFRQRFDIELRVQSHSYTSVVHRGGSGLDVSKQVLLPSQGELKYTPILVE